jgi:hypothetical protein
MYRTQEIPLGIEHLDIMSANCTVRVSFPKLDDNHVKLCRFGWTFGAIETNKSKVANSIFIYSSTKICSKRG